MLDEIYYEMNQLRKRAMYYTIGIVLVNLIITSYIIYGVIRTEDFLITNYFLIGFIILDSAFLIRALIKNYNRRLLIKHEQLNPYLIRTVNPVFRIIDEEFIDKEEYDTCIFDPRGYFKSLEKVVGNYQDIQFAFSFVNNIISSGNSNYIVFSGTYITFELPKVFDGMLQLRDKGKPVKKVNCDCHQYESDTTEKYLNIKFYTNNDQVAEQLIKSDIINLYLGIISKYNKRVYLSVVGNKLSVGLHTNKNMLDFNYFENINQDKIDKKILKLKELSSTIEKICDWIKAL